MIVCNSCKTSYNVLSHSHSGWVNWLGKREGSWVDIRGWGVDFRSPEVGIFVSESYKSACSLRFFHLCSIDIGIACITDQFKSPITVKDSPSFIEDKCPQQQNGELRLINMLNFTTII